MAETIQAGEQPLADRPESLGFQAWQRFRTHRLALIGSIVLLTLTFSFFAVPLFSPYGFSDVDPTSLRSGPSLEHPFGTDDIGRDLLVRSMKGGQFSIQIALVCTLVSTSFGALLGSIAGYFGGLVDNIISFLINVLLTVPIILVLLLFGQSFGQSPISIAILIALFIWQRAGRLVRAQVLQLKEQEFVQAARAIGASSGRIILRHLIPNLVGILLVELTLMAGTAIILESTLSFLGLGVQPPNTTLGTLIAESKGSLSSRPSRILIPGAVVTAIILSINFIGDALRDAVDPKSERT